MKTISVALAIALFTLAPSAHADEPNPSRIAAFASLHVNEVAPRIGLLDGRIYTSGTLHVGMRPSFLWCSDGPEVAFAVTVQIRLPLGE